MNRRKFLVTAAAGATGCSRRAQPPWRALTMEEAATLEAWCDCLIPEDADPGAKSARVVRFIDTQLTKKYKRYRKTYSGVLAALNAAARRTHQADFAALPFAERTALLAEFEKGQHAKAFDMVLDHAMQGFYGNPRHGGNAGFVSWHMLGVPPAPVRGQS
jgi:gluconate 2-dehydrogenase gamma chain